jgi:hypothetical protein
MGGASIGIFLPHPLTVDDRHWVLERLDAVNLTDLPLYFEPACIDGCLANPDDSTVLYVEQEFGFWPEAEAELWSGFNGVIGHRYIAEVAVEIAYRFQGIIDFGGPLLPPLSPELYKEWHNRKWSEVEVYSAQMLKKIPGRIVTIPYETESKHSTVNSREWVRHLSDATFLQSWLKHPNFHLIK